ncbi:MAG: radical SAM protein [Chloroflexi bacterium]|nr:MAG: radical SAM protein [Chloroflexota bacterium]
MDAIGRLKLLSAQMHLEPAEDAGCPKGYTKPDDIYLSRAVLPGGKPITLLKTLLTSACERNCFYCPFRAGRNMKRATFKPEEMANTYMSIYKAGAAQGIFLSSGIISGGITTQDKLIDTADILRNKLGYKGYLHLKIMPGAERDQVEKSMLLADRVSVNLEAPNTDRLLKLAPKKGFMEELLQPLRWVNEIRRSRSPYQAYKGRWPSTVTQFVVGAVGESDLELLSTTEYLYKQVRLGKTYYSAFSPIEDTPLEDVPPESPLRQLRLYQASFLLRDYGFSLEELPFGNEGGLPREIDPKVAWAQANLIENPVDVNRATRQELLRVPGFGPKSADAILTARRQGQKVRLHDIETLRKIGVNPKRAVPYILLDGKRPVHQMALF